MWPISASCIVGELNFYARLIASTLAPLVTLTLLLVTYLISLRRYPGNTAVAARERQNSAVRHASAALLVCFLVRVVRYVRLMWPTFLPGDVPLGWGGRGGRGEREGGEKFKPIKRCAGAYFVSTQYGNMNNRGFRKKSFSLESE